MSLNNGGLVRLHQWLGDVRPASAAVQGGFSSLLTEPARLAHADDWLFPDIDLQVGDGFGAWQLRAPSLSSFAPHNIVRSLFC